MHAPPHPQALQIVNLVSSHPRVSKLEFFIALALVARAQSGKGLPCSVLLAPCLV